MSSGLILLIFVFPFAIVSFFFLRENLKYSKLYRGKKNPTFPLVGEISKFIKENPTLTFKLLPIIPLLQWKIIFEKHEDKQLQKEANKVRFLFFLFIVIMILDFFLFAFLLWNQ